MMLAIAISVELLAILCALSARQIAVAAVVDRQVVAEITRVAPGNPGSADVTLSWQSFHNNFYTDASNIHQPDAMGNVDTVLGYEMQYSQSSSGEWVMLSNSITGLRENPEQPRRDQHEKQRIFTRADPGQTISDGFFRITMVYAGKSLLDIHERTITPPIPFDASEEQMKVALETLDVISKVQVFRRALIDTYGAYEWTILFDPPEDNTSVVDHGDLPLLILYTETISATWSGSGDQVTIQSVREGELERVLCSSQCVYVAAGLPAGAALAFRVRARYAFMGWSEWSITSETLHIPPTLLPGAPTAPEFVATTAKQITIKWKMPSSDQPASVSMAIFPILSFHLQQKCDKDLGWFTTVDVVPPGPHLFTFALSLERPPNSTCIFRVAAANANGKGPFSVASSPFHTKSTAPDAPRSVRILHNPIQLTWDPPARDGGSFVTSYDIQYRPLDSSTWIQALLNESEITNRLWIPRTHEWKSYTRYIIRIRATNALGSSKFVESRDFLTEFIVEDNKSVMDSSVVPPTNLPNDTIIRLMNASREEPANTIDRYYIQTIGGGGIGQMDGQNGLILLFPITFTGERLSERTYFFTGHRQVYQVPLVENNEAITQVVAVDVYGWGAGGGAGGKTSESKFSNGGGGAFARAIFGVSPGDVVELFVGGGGRGVTSGDVAGGFHGGGDGGRGDFAGGGGGGASEVRINRKTVLLAGGGGGGGATDYCCAHGGGGGGAGSAEDGMFPDEEDIPLDISTTKHLARDEYHSVNVEGDWRDFTGLPAHHQHLDYGFAGPDADYSRLATAGSGATAKKPGHGGLPSSYMFSRAGKCFVNEINGIIEIAGSLSAFSASNGQKGRGGKGQDGKEGGGGGGGGYYGGGGGGSGIDGAGGGGGSSFISFPDLYVLSYREPEQRMGRGLSWKQPGEHVETLQIAPITSTSIRLAWQNPRYGFSQNVEGFVIEMANRSANEDFRVLRITSATDMSAIIHDLTASSWYRFRIKVLLRDGSGGYSRIENIQMPRTPTNAWRHVSGVRSFTEQGTAAGLRFTDPSPLRRFPSARRGHSLTYLDRFLYMFGGYALGYRCNRSHKVACIMDHGVNNELWRFDIQTKIWKQIISNALPSTLPPPREKHSISAVGNYLLLFGGRTGDQNDTNAALNDLWELSISSSTGQTTASLRDLEQNIPIQDTKELFTIGYAGVDPGLCVSSMSIQLRIMHTCLQTLHVQLFGPGPSTFPQRQQNTAFPTDSQAQELRWSNSDNFTAGDKRVTPMIPSARSFPVTLQSPVMTSDHAACLAGSHVLKFTSTSGQLNNTKHFEAPLESLSVFHQLPASKGWTLSVADTAADGFEGTLLEWDISFALKPCVPTFTWKNITAIPSGKPPSPRFQHAAIVYQSSMFIFGGRNGSNGKELNDLYRLDYASSVGTSKWIQLLSLTSSTTGDEKRFYTGRTILVTPFQLLAIGQGIQNPQRATELAHRFGSGQYVGLKSVTDPRKGWYHISTNNSGDDNQNFPSARYWSASAFVADGFSTLSHSHVYIFGGQDDTTILDDLWQLDLDLLTESNPVSALEALRNEICDWRLTNAAYQKTWNESCFATSAIITQNQATECKLETLLLYTWCAQIYQSMIL